MTVVFISQDNSPGPWYVTGKSFSCIPLINKRHISVQPESIFIGFVCILTLKWVLDTHSDNQIKSSRQVPDTHFRAGICNGIGHFQDCLFLLQKTYIISLPMRALNRKLCSPNFSHPSCLLTPTSLLFSYNSSLVSSLQGSSSEIS